MFDQQAKLDGFHDQKRTVKVTMTPDGSYPSFQFIEFRTEEAAKQYVSVVNGRCDKDGEIGYKAEIINTVTIRRADNLAAELNYLKLSTDDYDDARMRLGDDVIPARIGTLGWRFNVGRHGVEKTGKDRYSIYASNGLHYELVGIDNVIVEGEPHTKYQLLDYNGMVEWEDTEAVGKAPRKLIAKVGQYPVQL